MASCCEVARNWRSAIHHKGFSICCNRWGCRHALQQTPVKVVESDLYIAASLDFSDGEIALWQQALNRLKASGEFERLYRMPPLTLADVAPLPTDDEGKMR